MDSQLIIPKETKASLQTTWKIYKSQWKTFIALTGFIILAYLIYAIIDTILTLLGYTPSLVTDNEYVSSGSVLLFWLIRTPIWIIYSVLGSLLSVCYMVIPALYFHNKEIINWKVPYKEVIRKNFKRYFLGGILYGGAVLLGYLFCIIPGIVISFIGPAYLNKIACSEMPVLEVFKSSFKSVFKSPNLWPYIGMQILAGIIFGVATLCTCGIGQIITLPMLCIYSQHLAYNKGILN